ncbi:MAG TPA: hypothetical protein DCM57_06140 [Treponema sp.]|nr:hypothetical protein [Treponema sp.]
MKFKVSFFITFAIYLTVGICLFAFRSMPVARIWTNYSVLYVDSSVQEATVLFYLEQAGCRDVISLSQQRVPTTSVYTPVMPVDSSYLTSRLSYFKDESSRYQLFYIPEQYQEEAGTALQLLVKGTGAHAGLDGTEQYPWAVPLVCVLTFIVLFLASKKKSVFLVPSVFPLMLSFSQPFYVVAAAVCLSLLALYLINGLWIRRKFASAIFRSIYIDVLIFVPMVLLFSSGLLYGFLGLGIFAAITLSFVLMKFMHDYREYKSAFSFLPIFSAWQIPVVYKRTAKWLIGAVLPVSALIALFLISTMVAPAASMNGLSVPSPVQSGGEIRSQLPTISDYYALMWQMATFPYKSLHEDNSKPPADGDKITVSHFIETENGIQKTEDTLFTYNDKYRTGLKNQVKELDYGAIEKLMISQGESVPVVYSTGAESKTDSQHNTMNLILLFLAAGIPLVLYGAYFVNGRKKYENSK